MYRTCGFPDCTVGFEHCRIHHVTYWEHFGRTDLDNLIPLCELHHHLVHEGGWTLQLHPGRRITLRRPDGTVSFDGVTTNRTTSRRSTWTSSIPATRPGPAAPASCRRKRPPPTTVDEIAEELQLALDEICANAP